jgi:type VII secretion ATPase EccA
VTAYSDTFDDALRRWSAGDRHGALTGFTSVTHADPSVADAWLGRIAAGDLALATLEAAHENSRFLFRETRRVNWNDGELAGQIECPKYFVMEINSRAGIALAYAAALIAARRYGDAETVLADPALQTGPAGQWRHFLRTCMFYVTERWHDVVATAANPSATPQSYEQALAGKVRAAVTTMAAVAAARLGRYEHAIDLLADAPAHQADNPYIQADAALARAWSERALGNHAVARSWFEQAVIGGSLVSDARAALADETLLLPVVTEEMIAVRTDPWDVSTQPSAQSLSDAELEKQRRQAGEQWRHAIDELIGHEDVKEQISVWRTEIEIEQVMAEYESRPVKDLLGGHIVLLGPPGTAKTTWARIFKDILFELGMIPEWKLTEVTEEDLVKGWVSQTAEQTRRVLDEALGGVLFIDEAYRLAPKTEGHTFGGDAINTLLKYMEDKAGQLVVIAAGYPTEMRRFLNANPGFASRFHLTYNFHGYTPEQIRQIGELLAAKEHLSVDDDAWSLLEAEAQRLHDVPTFGNGRYAREVIKHCRSERARRMQGHDGAALRELAARGQLGVTADDMRRALAIAGRPYN